MTVAQMTRRAADLEQEVRRALDTVFDPELDEPITDLGFVRSVVVDGKGSVTVHLRLPTSFCAPNFVWLMASDAREAVRAVPGADRVTVELDDHHDSELVNRGLAAGKDFKATFGAEAEQDLDALRSVFRRKAHVAAMERAATAWLKADPARTEADVAGLVLADLSPGRSADALIRRRNALGWSSNPQDHVLVDEHGRAVAPDEAGRRLRMARSVRVSVDGNASFCRGLLATRYPGAEADQAPRADGDGATRAVLPLVLRSPRGARA